MPISAPMVAMAKQAMTSQLEIGWCDFVMIKQAKPSSNRSPSQNGHLGTVQFFRSFIVASFTETRRKRKQTRVAAGIPACLRAGASRPAEKAHVRTLTLGVIRIGGECEIMFRAARRQP